MCAKIRAWLFGLAVVLVAQLAVAGTLQVHDRANLLSSSDAEALRAAARDGAFDVRLLTSTDAASKDDFDRQVAAAVKPDLLVIGVDPTHRHTSVRFGRSLAIDPSHYATIEQAGSAYFKRGEWRAGIEAILAHARSEHGGAAPAASSAQPQSPTASSGHGLLVGGILFILVIAGGVVLISMVLRRAFGGGRNGGPYMGGRPQPPYGAPPGYGPGNPYQQGGGGGIGSGIIGAGLGGLAGYELGKMMGGREERERLDQTDDPVRLHNHSEGQNPDGGGASSDWDQNGNGNGGGDWDSSGTSGADVGGGWDGGGSNGGGWDGGGSSDGGGGGQDW